MKPLIYVAEITRNCNKHTVLTLPHAPVCTDKRQTRAASMQIKCSWRRFDHVLAINGSHPHLGHPCFTYDLGSAYITRAVLEAAASLASVCERCRRWCWSLLGWACARVIGTMEGGEKIHYLTEAIYKVSRRHWNVWTMNDEVAKYSMPQIG